MSTKFTNDTWRMPRNANQSKSSNYSWNYAVNAKFNISSPANAGITSSISFWFKRAVVTNVSQPYEINNIYGMWMSNTTMYIRYGSTAITVDSAAGLTQDGLNALTSTDWVHWVLIREATATSTAQNFKMYANTKEVFSSSSPSNFGTNNTEVDMIWATNQSQSTSIDSFSVFNYALSPSQITTLYGSSSIGIGNPMSLSPKPVAYYSLGEYEAYNGANYLTPNDSLKDYVFSFDGSSQYIDLGNSIYQVGTGDVTISAWANTSTTASGNVDIFGLGDNTTSEIRLQRQANKFGAYVNSSTASGQQLVGATTISTGQWYSVILVKSSNVFTLYLNGISDNNITWTGGALNATGGSIGAYFGGGSNRFNGYISNVQIFNTALPATGSNSVETLYNNGSPLTSMSGFTSLQGWWKLDASDTYDSSTGNWSITDHSSNSNTGTSSGMTQANLVQSDLSFTSGYSPYALNFDAASSDYIDCGNVLDNIFTGSDFSVSTWIYATTNTTYNNFFNKATTVQFYLHSNKIKIYLGSSSSGIWPLESTATLSLNTWYNIIFTRLGNENKLYINASLDNSATSTSSIPSSTGSLTLSSYLGSSYFWDGSISNPSVWNTALSQAQVTEIYNEGVPSNLNNHSAYSNLVSWWQLGSNSSFNTNWTVLDEKGSNNGTSVNMGEDAIVDGVGSYANAVSVGLGALTYLAGEAPYSTANAKSINMGVTAKGTDVP